MTSRIPLGTFTDSDLTASLSHISRLLPIICTYTDCFRLMLKHSYRRHCVKYHNFSVEDNLPDFTVDDKLFSFLLVYLSYRK